MREVNNSEDILDSRDVIARRDELKEERDRYNEAAEEKSEMSGEGGRAGVNDWVEDCPEDAEELAQLEAFIAEGSDSWEDGETLVRETYFKDYAQELADDLHGERMAKNEWPFSCIDWEKAARELQYDYTGADWDGVTYYFRS